MLDHTMFYAKELDLAKTFLEALEAAFAPEEFRDEYRAELEAMIAKKTA
jgi:non-homologous end joining protein Ku